LLLRPLPAAIFLAVLRAPIALADEPPLPTTAPTTAAPAGSAAPAPTITPPVVQTSTNVPYPPGARGDATVILDVEIDKVGRVSSAVVAEGTEPFAEQARRAVLEWRFSPARRGDAPVASRIRARVDFRQAEVPATSPPTPPVEEGAAAPATPASNAVIEVPEEVEVRGKRREIGETTLSAPDVREMPGAFGDPFRAIEALPGVMPIVSGLPFFYIRGAPPTNNAYLVDGIRVPLLFHVGIGEGVIHPSLIDHVDFYPGAAPAAYGHSAGAVIAGQTRDPAIALHGEANVRLLDAGALLEAPLAVGRGAAANQTDSRVTVLAAGRYGYPGPIVSAVTSTLRLGYWDYQARVTWRTDDRNTLSLFAFGSHDYLGAASINNGQTGPIVEQLGSDFHRIDLRYDRALHEGHIRVAATLGYDSLGGAGGGENAAVTTVTNVSAAARLEVEQKLAPALRLRGGADAQIDHYRFAQGQAPNDSSGAAAPQIPSSADPPPTNVTGGIHADVVWRISPRVEIVPGVRVDVFGSTRANGPGGAEATTLVPAFDPRLSARVTIAPWIAWLSSLGLSHQYPVLRVGAIPALLVSVPGFPAGDTELQTAAQASEGVEVRLPLDFTLTATGFFSGWSGLTDLTASCIQIMPATAPPPNPNGAPKTVPWTCPSSAPVHGIAYGLEVLLRRALTKRLSGWLSYTLSRSTRQEHFITASGGDVEATVVSDYDRTHMLNAILAYDLGLGWHAGGRFVFFTGTPFSNLAGNVPVPPYNNQRDPPFYRVDVRLEKRWRLAREGFVAVIAEVQNVTLNKEVTPLGLDCKGTDTMTQCKHASIGPLTLPSLGVEASF
jgi:TonB family protein